MGTVFGYSFASGLDLARRSILRLTAEGVGSARGGLRARAGARAPLSRRDLLSQCCARTATVYGLVMFVVWLGWERWTYTSTFASETRSVYGVVARGLPLVVLLGLATGLALVGYRRLAGLAGLAWIGFYLAGVLSRPAFLFLRGSNLAYDLHSLALIVVPLVCYLVMIVAPGAGDRRSQRLGWLLGAWLLGGIVAGPGAPLELFASIGTDNALLVSVLILGVCSLAIDGWRAVAFALALLAFGLGSWMWTLAIDRYEYLPLALTTLGPVLLMVGAAARMLSARRELPV